MVAIYARQSVDKKDSISIESQIETCKRKLLPNEDSSVSVYEDKGFSGKSTNRPEFQRMIDDIKHGRIEKIIVYKLDRISRSLLDFLNMQADFEKYSVEFVSCSENFDTSTSFGKMVMNILMMFAQMEREAIQQRITDNYYRRGEMGFYLGGYAPFGYKKVETQHNGKKTYTFEPIPEQVDIVTSIYEDYAYHHKSLNEIARRLNSAGILSKRDGNWNMQGVARTLHNPVYVKANADIYTFLRARGATMNNEVDEYIGINGCYVYGNAEKRKKNKASKFVKLDTDHVTLGLHPGIIESDLWLLVQSRFNHQQKVKNLGSGKLSWAQGLVRCKHCNFSCYVKHYRNSKNGKTFRYFYCRGKRNGTCQGSRKMVKAETVEQALEYAVLQRVELGNYVDNEREAVDNEKLNLLKIELQKVESRIERLISRLEGLDNIATMYVNKRLDELHKERAEIDEQITEIQLQASRFTETFDFEDILNHWADFGTDKKAAIAKSLIECVEVDGDDMEIRLLF